MKVLIVEDDIVFCKLLTKYLNNNSVNTNDAQSAEAAKKLLAAETFDFVVIDYKLPDEDGLAVLQWMDQEHIEARKILMSRFEDETVIRKATDLGVKKFIKKPIKPNELLELIRELK
ncbi:response regulator [Sinomicrobium sp. FJxs]|uniref:Response regulator n=1 Tax=Sinomicrobium weinanense TaxID=2842200 RepID=A0A926JP06_9FLAO|nr:response regulator [Sinomicrobium weinanense]